MVQLTLPKNSQVTAGKAWAAPPDAHDLRQFRIYRWNPEDGHNPRLDTYQVDGLLNVFKSRQERGLISRLKLLV